MKNPALRALWLAFSLLLSTLTGTAGGALAWIGGDNPAKAIMTGAATFAATTTLIILILVFTTSASVPPARR